MIKLVVFDLDNTLVSHTTESIPQSAIEACRKLKEKGIKILLASGRDVADPYMEMVCRQTDPDYYVTVNGQAIYLKGMVVHHRHYISNQDVENVCKLAKELGIFLFWKFPSGVYVYSDNPDVSRYRRGYPTIAHSYWNRHLQEPVIGGSFMSIHYTEEQMKEMFPSLNFIDIGHCYEMTSRGVNKLTSIKEVLDIEGITLEEVMAFGDSNNDREIIEAAETGVAMGNGIGDIKQIADYVTNSCDDDGIYNALVHFGVIE